jgi:hypothetical protein
MAANPLLSNALPVTPAPAEPAAREQSGSSLGHLSRLRALHEEAEETARLANLLGRTVYAGATLAIASVTTILFATTDLPRALGWEVLMLLAIGALLHAYRHTMAAPFERAALRSFADDLKAILLYAGFAWGAGAFLVLGVAASPLAAIFYSAGMAATLALLLRSATPVLYFTLPVAGLGAASALIGGHVFAAFGAIAACAAVTVASHLLDQHRDGERTTSAPAGISLA